MLPEAQIKVMMRAPDAGYASVYAFDEAAAQEILAEKSSKGLSRFPVYTDRLVIDLDDGDRQLKKAIAAIVALGLSHQVWHSGGKGYHVIIPLTDEVQGIDVPYSQRKWVEGLDVGADLSLYQHGRILSLPGRVHPKTGVRKHLVSDFTPGLRLLVPSVSQARPTFQLASLNGGDLTEALFNLYCLTAQPPGVGNRHTKLWSASEQLAQTGLSYETVLDLMLTVNEQWDSPKDAAEVKAAVIQAYQRSPSRPTT